MSTLGIYPEELVRENFYFWWPGRTKMQRIYERIFKSFNGDHKYLRCPYLKYNNFDIMSSSIMLYKVDPVCAKTVKSKPTVKYSGFITYSNIIYFSGIWLDKCYYIIN